MENKPKPEPVAWMYHTDQTIFGVSTKVRHLTLVEAEAHRPWCYDVRPLYSDKVGP